MACVRVDVSPDTPGGGSTAETFLWYAAGPPRSPPTFSYTTPYPADGPLLSGRGAIELEQHDLPTVFPPLGQQAGSPELWVLLHWSLAVCSTFTNSCRTSERTFSEDWIISAVTAHRRSLFRNSPGLATCQPIRPQMPKEWASLVGIMDCLSRMLRLTHFTF